MICLICRQAEIVAKLTSVSFKRDEIRLVINNVPARVCPSCGEAYVDEAVATRLLEIANDMSITGMVDVQSEYNTAQI